MIDAKLNNQSKTSILYIDDDKQLVKLVTSMLDVAGYDVLQAYDGIHGIEAYRANNPDIVITDLVMPNMDGHDVLKTIKNESPDTPVIVVSGNGGISDIIEALNNNANGYIEKPFKKELLYSVVDQAAEKIKLNKENMSYQAKLEDTNEQLTMLNTELNETNEELLRNKAKLEHLLEINSNLELKTNELKHEADHDGLTGLLNQKAFLNYLENILSQKTLIHSYDHALLFMDLDNFKTINDNYGHIYGDEILREFAKRLRMVSKERDVLSRYGGDEFTIFMHYIPTKEILYNIGQRIFESVSKPYQVIDKVIRNVSASIGICVIPEHGTDVKTVTENADTAMYNAKKNSEKVVIYQPDMEIRKK